jgi:hypothetical protein
MTNLEALQILDNIAAQTALVRKDAVLVQTAIDTLAKLIASVEIPDNQSNQSE